MKVIIALLVTALCIACGATTPQPIGPRSIVCPDIGTCMMEANKGCRRGFTMVVQDGTRSAKTITAWQPSPDGKFHLAVGCQ
jgi:hypothetical protein